MLKRQSMYISGYRRIKMSFFKSLGHALTGGLAYAHKKVRDPIEGLANKLTGNKSAAEKRGEASLINEQIKSYKDQTAMAQKEIDAARAEKDVQKRKVNEKQIRSLRNSYRPAGGLLNNQAGRALGADQNNSAGLPNKLGA